MPATTTDVALPSEQRQTLTIAQVLDKQRGEFERALPSHVGVDRFMRVALTTIKTNPKLGACSGTSLIAGLMQAAQLGLEVSGVRGQAYLIPRGREATFQLGYRGMIDLAARSGITVDVDIIHENDRYEFQRGTDPKLVHLPTLDEPGRPVAYYAVAHFADDRRSQFVIRSVAAIKAHRDKFRSQKTGGPWDDHFDAMALKTVIRMLLDKLPTTIELRQAVVADEQTDTVQATYAGPSIDPIGAIDTAATDVPANVDENGVIDADGWDTDGGPLEDAEPTLPVEVQ